MSHRYATKVRGRGTCSGRCCVTVLKKRRPTNAEAIGSMLIEEGLDHFYWYGGGASDPWGDRLCDDGSCEWCQRRDEEWRAEAIAAGAVFEISSPPVTHRIGTT